jgi:hypothetical protein
MGSRISSALCLFVKKQGQSRILVRQLLSSSSHTIAARYTVEHNIPDEARQG